MTSSPTVSEAESMQLTLAAAVESPATSIEAPRVVAGTDVSYETGTDRVAAAVVAVDLADGRVLEEVVTAGRAEFPYIPGLLAFREIPTLPEALGRLRTPVDLLLCDGQGLAHPRRCGLACHLGVVTGLPAVGCAKNHVVGAFDEPGPRRGDRSSLVDHGHVVGEVLRTQDGSAPSSCHRDIASGSRRLPTSSSRCARPTGFRTRSDGPITCRARLCVDIRRCEP